MQHISTTDVIQVIRIVAITEEDGTVKADVRYQTDPKSGFMPRVGVRGAPGIVCSNWATEFAHPDPAQGHPVNMISCHPLLTGHTGKKQSWM